MNEEKETEKQNNFHDDLVEGYKYYTSTNLFIINSDELDIKAKYKTHIKNNKSSNKAIT